MLTVEERSRRFKRPLRGPPALQNGDRLRSQEFLRRYEGMPELKKAGEMPAARLWTIHSSVTIAARKSAAT